MVHLTRPFEKAPEVGALVPDKLPKFQKTNIFHLYAAISFYAPQKIWTTPRREAMAASCIPPETKHGRHELYS